MSKQYVFLSMHRTASSLVSSWCHVMGVNMGDNLLGAREGNPYGHWESLEFLELNDDILTAAGGTWHHPPSHEDIMLVEPEFEERIALLVEYYDQENEQWGFKDPRTCLTAELYHKHLSDPRYIVTQRSVQGIAESLLERHEPVYEAHAREWYIEYWQSLAVEYGDRVETFLANHEVEPFRVQYHEALDRRKAHIPINELADLIGAPPSVVRKAFHQVRFRV